MTIKNTDRAELIVLIKELIAEPDTNKEILKPVVKEMMVEYANATDKDKALLKNIVKEILTEDKSLLKNAIREVMAEKQSPEAIREAELKAKMDKHFDEFDEVFKALA